MRMMRIKNLAPPQSLMCQCRRFEIEKNEKKHPQQSVFILTGKLMLLQISDMK